MNHNTIYQVSVFGATFEGLLDGILPLDQVAALGDFGIGGVEGLEGELTILDGHIYHSAYDFSESEVAGDKLTIKSPKISVTTFHNPTEMSFHNGLSLNELVTHIQDKMQHKNIMAAVKVTGKFHHIELLSYPSSQKPFPQIEDLIKQRRTKIIPSMRGTLVGFIYPGHLTSLTGPGYHFHFLDQSKQIGGHVLNADLFDYQVMVSKKDALNIHLPDNADFYRMKISDPKKRLDQIIRTLKTEEQNSHE